MRPVLLPGEGAVARVGAGTPEPTESQCKNLESCSPASEQPGDGCTEAMGMLMIMMD